jgi:2-polyprenyl-3-methyl-5-hydroxy-6-metoxy-1,4-benzoquinol methylase
MKDSRRQNQPPKVTSYAYGEDAYQKYMAQYYKESKVISASNHEYLRVRLAFDLVEKWVLPHLSCKQRAETTVVDVACSVGTFAIEFAKQGYKSFGVDFDPDAIKIARHLNEEEGANALFAEMDVSDWNGSFPPIDIAICFDVFEHLHDDELGALLYALRSRFSPDGALVFHSLPQQYDYLFWNHQESIVEFPFLLRPFKNCRTELFEKIVKTYALLRDMESICRTGLTHKESIKRSDHPNPLTKVRLTDIFDRAGYEILAIDSGFLGNIQIGQRDRQSFLNQPLTHRSLFGVAIPLARNAPILP